MDTILISVESKTTAGRVVGSSPVIRGKEVEACFLNNIVFLFSEENDIYWFHRDAINKIRTGIFLWQIAKVWTGMEIPKESPKEKLQKSCRNS